MFRELISKEICMTKDLGLHGNLFGGIMLSYIDKVGAIYACEQCVSDMLVTLSMDKVLFRKPIKVGDVLYFYGEVLKFGNSSISIKIDVFRKNITNHTDLELACSTNIVFVKVDDNGKSCKIESPNKDLFNKQEKGVD